MNGPTLTTLIAHLTALREAHGDLPVRVIDAEGVWKFGLHVENVEEDNGEPLPAPVATLLLDVTDCGA